MKLFDPLIIKAREVKNRFVRSATCEYMADADGRPDARFMGLYQTLARGNIGIIITGYAYVMANGKSNPGQSAIDQDDLIPAWKKVADLVKGTGSLFLMQIVHGGRQVRLKGHSGEVWAPSAIPDNKFKTQPLAMTIDQINSVKQAFIKGALRAEESGFDGVQLHVAHGYLLSQFLSPYTNQRGDEYGGSQYARTRIIAEIIQGIRAKTSSSFIISAKINGDDCLSNGLTVHQAAESARIMEQAGLDLIEVSGGMAESRAGAVRDKIETIDDEAYFRSQAGIIKNKTSLITASVGGYRSLGLMEETVNNGHADLISLCRPFIRQPDLVEGFIQKTWERADCISCNRCFNPRGINCWHLRP